MFEIYLTKGLQGEKNMKGLRRYLFLSAGLFLIPIMIIVLASCVSNIGNTGNPAISSITASFETIPSPTSSLTTMTALPTVSANLTTSPTSTLLPTSSPVVTQTSPVSANVTNVTIEVQVTDFDVVSNIGSTTGDGYLIYYMIQLPSLGMFPFPPSTMDIIPSPTETTTLTPAPNTTPVTPTTTAPITPIIPTTTTPITPIPTTVPAASPILPENQQIPSTQLSNVWNNLSAGTYIFSVQLVDTSGMALSPPVVSAVVFMVP